MAEALCSGADAAPEAKPTRSMVARTTNNSATEQAGHDLDHTEALKAHNANKEQHEVNNVKACALVCSSCNKIMKIQEHN